MAFVAGDPVILLPSNTLVDGSLAPLLGGGGAPILGKVDAVASPSVKVTWQNGITSDYLDDGAQLTASQAPASIDKLHTRVTVTGAFNGPANSAGQGASEGLVVAMFGTIAADYVVIKFSAGDIAIFPVAAVS